MKAPELPTKIYFTILDMGSGYVYTPSLDDNGGTEYIRKDALLEWLEVIKVQSLELREKGYGDVFYGAQITLSEEIIDKLNKM